MQPFSMHALDATGWIFASYRPSAIQTLMRSCPKPAPDSLVEGRKMTLQLLYANVIHGDSYQLKLLFLQCFEPWISQLCCSSSRPGLTVSGQVF